MISQDVKYGVQDGQLFSVTCPKDDDKSFPALFKIIKEFIETEIGKAPEVFEVPPTASAWLASGSLTARSLGHQSH